MQAIPKDEFIQMVMKTMKSNTIFEDEISTLFKEFGDSWFYDGAQGDFVKEIDNTHAREKLLNGY